MPYPPGYDQYSVNRRFIWFGTTQKFQWLPMPSSGAQVVSARYSESGVYENGGGWVDRSNGSHRVYAFDFGVREASYYGGLDLYEKYASGFYGTGLIHWADPAEFALNLCPPQWASPTLVLNNNSWHHIGTYASDAATATNSYDQPARTITYSVNSSTEVYGRTSSRLSFTIPIPPTHKLVFGWSGARSNANVGIGYTTYLDGIATDVATPIAPLANTGPWRLSTTLSGASYDAVRFYLKGTSTPQTVSVTSMMAQLVPIAATADLMGGQGGNHIIGRGSTGCRFDDDAATESYIAFDTTRHLKGLSTSLRETGGWE